MSMAGGSPQYLAKIYLYRDLHATEYLPVTCGHCESEKDGVLGDWMYPRVIVMIDVFGCKSTIKMTV